MHKKKRKKSHAAAWLLVVGASIILGTGIFPFSKETYTYRDENEETILYNPLIGFAPSADYSEAVGKSSLVYIDILWSEIEAEEGVYDFTKVYEENNIVRWKEEGKKAVFRFVCDMPGQDAHMDIPEWLYEKTGKDGDFYDTDYGKGYAPNYANEVLIEAHRKVICALAEEFGKDNFFAYIELGSIGHWGEWHVKYDDDIERLPSEEICARYVDHYREAFPDTRLLMRRPFFEVKEQGLGVFNDMVGEPESTSVWLDWIEHGGSYEEPAEPHRIMAVGDVWNKAPVGGEFTSSLTWKEMLSDHWEETRKMILDSHMSFIGPKCPHEKEEECSREQREKLLELLGYKIGIGEGKCTYNKFTEKWSISLCWNNKGAAPMYYDWNVYLYLLDEQENILAKIPVDMKLTTLTGGSEIQTKTKFKLSDFGVEKEKTSAIGVGIEDPMSERPAVRLNNQNSKEGSVYILWDFACISDET